MKKFMTVVLLVAGMQGLSGLRGLHAQPGWYVGNKAPLQPLHFMPLPVGSIRPEGWVLKYLELQRDGLTGQLGQISAWLDKTNNAWYSGNGQGDHGWEEVPYWLKGYGDLGYILNDTTIIAETKRWLNKVFQSQRADGYFGPQMKEMDLWPNMLMLWCMQSYYDYSKDARVIPFMTRYFKWEMTVPDGQLLKTYWENSRGGDNLYSVYWLYNHTGEAWLLDLAKKIHQHTANWEQAGPGGGSGKLPNWHNVNIAQCFREPATYYMQTADKRDLDATYNDFRLVRAIYGQVPGGMFGADENARPGYTDPRQAVETCGMVEQMASDEMLAEITGDVLWADNCEDVAFNTYPAAVMPDFKSLRYLTAPNMVVSDTMDHSPGIQNKGPFLMMNPFSSRCCQHNHAQGWPYYSEHLWMATPDSGVVAMLYGASTVKVRVGDGREVTLVEKTNYPFEERVRITVKGIGAAGGASAAGPASAAGSTGGAANFPLWLRIPGWCDGATVMVNGVPGHISAQSGGYARIARAWKTGDMVELKLPMKVSLRKWETNKNSASVNYGPLSFSLRITENYRRMNSERAAQDDSKWQASADPAKWPAYEITPGSKWNYGLVLTDKPLAQQFEVVRRPYPGGGFPWSAEAVPLLLKVKGDLIPGWGIDQYGLCGVLPQSPVDVEDGGAAGQGGSGQGGPGVQTIELIPMGAARLRISSFPVANIIPRKERPVTGPPVQVHPAEWIEVLKPEGANIFDTTGGVQVIARGFKWTEGPLYVPAGGGGGGAGDYLLFSDVPHNKIYKWKRNGDTSVFLMPSGFTGTGVKEREPGSNGLLYDKYSGSLLLMQQGDRRVAKMDAPLNAAAPKFVVLADHYKGKRLNSPNDGVLAPDGGIYFTDPPYGLDGLLADTAKELTFQGVFYIRADHRLALVTDELKYPNGIALSPDGKTLYVDNSDSLDRRWMKYGLGEDGLIKDKHVFFQYSGVERGNPDGMKVNKAGYVFSAGPGGLWVFNPAGVPVARVHVGQLVSNCAFGKDGKELFITATDRVLRVGLR